MIDNYYKRQVYPFVVNLIENFVDANGYEKTISSNDISDSDVATFAAILLAENPDDVCEIMFSPSVLVCAQAALRTADKIDALIFAEQQLENIVLYFLPTMERILIEVHEKIITERKETANWE
jgi:hypothetical protein